jgi:hypothetical protein
MSQHSKTDIGPIVIIFVQDGDAVGSVTNVKDLEVIIRDYDLDSGPRDLDPDYLFVDTPLKADVYSEGIRIFGDESSEFDEFDGDF